MILNYIKRKIGLTLIEVLVSVVLTCIVSVYGMSFFSAAWRLNVQSQDYSRVLRNLEKVIEQGKGHFMKTGGTVVNRTVTIPNETLREGEVVLYTYSETVDNGSVSVAATAQWPESEVVSERHKIGIRTHFAPVWVE